jgi:CAAX prenyl protease-like protein
VLGAAVVVPVAEELAFRGYLLTACQKLFETKTTSSQRVATSLALLVTSIGFGLLHANWISGTFAGLTYGALRLRTNSIANAVLAHAATNFALALYVLHHHAWSL